MAEVLAVAPSAMLAGNDRAFDRVDRSPSRLWLSNNLARPVQATARDQPTGIQAHVPRQSHGQLRVCLKRGEQRSAITPNGRVLHRPRPPTGIIVVGVEPSADLVSGWKAYPYLRKSRSSRRRLAKRKLSGINNATLILSYIVTLPKNYTLDPKIDTPYIQPCYKLL